MIHISFWNFNLINGRTRERNPTLFLTKTSRYNVYQHYTKTINFTNNPSMADSVFSVYKSSSCSTIISSSCRKVLYVFCQLIRLRPFLILPSINQTAHASIFYTSSFDIKFSVIKKMKIVLIINRRVIYHWKRPLPSDAIRSSKSLEF